MVCTCASGMLLVVHERPRVTQYVPHPILVRFQTQYREHEADDDYHEMIYKCTCKSMNIK
jgi:hypothetical protein